LREHLSSFEAFDFAIMVFLSKGRAAETSAKRSMRLASGTDFLFRGCLPLLAFAGANSRSFFRRSNMLLGAPSGV
jgi:hypothetical protein